MTPEILFFPAFNFVVMDPCVFIKKTISAIIFVLIWVDDLIICASSMQQMIEFKNIFKRRFKIKDLGEVRWFLGMQIIREDKYISINQSLYIKTILNRFEMQDATPRTLPCDPSIYHLMDKECEPLENIKIYQEMVGCLIYHPNGIQT